jgi:hypothetical protein
MDVRGCTIGRRPPTDLKSDREEKVYFFIWKMTGGKVHFCLRPESEAVAEGLGRHPGQTRRWRSGGTAEGL